MIIIIHNKDLSTSNDIDYYILFVIFHQQKKN